MNFDETGQPTGKILTPRMPHERWERWEGIVYVDHEHQINWCCPVPWNLVLRLAHDLWWWMQCGFHKARICRERRIWQEGYEAGQRAAGRWQSVPVVEFKADDSGRLREAMMEGFRKIRFIPPKEQK